MRRCSFSPGALSVDQDFGRKSRTTKDTKFGENLKRKRRTISGSRRITLQNFLRLEQPWGAASGR